MPLTARFAIWTALAALTGGAAYLMVTRGPAIMLDLAGAIAVCF